MASKLPALVCAFLLLATASHAADAGAPTAGPPTQAAPGNILVRDPERGVVELPLKLLEPRAHYRLTLKLYRVADDPAVTYPFLPLPADAQPVGDTQLGLLDGSTANFNSVRSGAAQRPPQPGDPPLPPGHPAILERTLLYSTMCFAYGPTADRTLASPYGPLDGAQHRLMAAADHLAVGGFDVYVYAPGANRVEVFIERGDITPQLHYTAGQPIPELVPDESPDYRPYAWLAAQLRAAEQGWLFLDGTTAPEPQAPPAPALPSTSA